MTPERTAYAKINLNLHVLGRRPDGYHELQSLVVFGQTGDTIQLVPSETDADQISIDGPFFHLLSGEKQNNLALIALRKFRRKWPDALADPIHIHLRKNLPVAAGLGGGSADAAAVLSMLSEHTNIHITDEDLYAFALELGADVPVCLAGKSALMAGIGERITPVTGLPKLFCVLINPMKSVSTAKIFSALSCKNNTPLSPMPKDMSNISEFVRWLESTRNDLETVACKIVPEIEKIRSGFMRDRQCLFARMSGSGASVVALFASQADADAAAQNFGKKHPDYWVQSAPIVH